MQLEKKLKSAGIGHGDIQEATHEASQLNIQDLDLKTAFHLQLEAQGS